jgi:CRISPR/Cas system-associated exonuclease Cas4 (RecB family)
MTLPEGFRFSQSSLQDFVDCRRRFQLRYIKRLSWPAIESEPIMQHERFIQRGGQFHHMVQQHLVGVSAQRLRDMLQDDDLARWWENYLQFQQKLSGLEDLELSAARRHPELSLSAPLAGYRLMAKYDLILVADNGNVVIIDWKTSPQQPNRNLLANRLQTQVYPYLFIAAGAHLNHGERLRPEALEMVYLYVEYPENPIRFSYSLDKFQKDQAYLQDLIKTIQHIPEDQFHLTTNEKHCNYCVYRSLCNRGVQAGSLEDLEFKLEAGEDSEVYLDFEQIAEIEF